MAFIETFYPMLWAIVILTACIVICFSIYTIVTLLMEMMNTNNMLWH